MIALAVISLISACRGTTSVRLPMVTLVAAAFREVHLRDMVQSKPVCRNRISRPDLHICYRGVHSFEPSSPSPHQGRFVTYRAGRTGWCSDLDGVPHRV